MYKFFTNANIYTVTNLYMHSRAHRHGILIAR